MPLSPLLPASARLTTRLSRVTWRGEAPPRPRERLFRSEYYGHPNEIDNPAVKILTGKKTVSHLSPLRLLGSFLNVGPMRRVVQAPFSGAGMARSDENRSVAPGPVRLPGAA